MPVKLTYDTIFYKFKDKGFTLLSTEYTDSHSPLEYLCLNKHKHTATYTYFCRNLGCRECQKANTWKRQQEQKAAKAQIPKKSMKGIPRKFSLEFVTQYMMEQSCWLISDNYTTDRIKLKFVCMCGNEAEQNFNSFYHAGHRCNNKVCIQDRMKSSLLEKHGVTNPMHIEESKDKLKQTNLKRYGVACVFQNINVQNKIKETNVQKYGVENVFQLEISNDSEQAYRLQAIKDKMKDTCINKYGVQYASQSDEVKLKMKQTNLERYGTEYASSSHTIKEKVKQTVIERYGVEFAGQAPEIKEKIRQTFLDRYGLECPMNAPDIQAQIRQRCLDQYGVEFHGQRPEVIQKRYDTNLARYGVVHALQNAEIAEKASRNSFLRRDYTLPSGNVIGIQGYEDKVLDNLLQHYTEEDIKYKRTDMPEIWYIGLDGKYHKYYPDFYIERDNLIIETKSVYTYTIECQEFHMKRKAVEYLGYNFKSYIYKTRTSKATVVLYLNYFV